MKKYYLFMGLLNLQRLIIPHIGAYRIKQVLFGSAQLTKFATRAEVVQTEYYILLIYYETTVVGQLPGPGSSLNLLMGFPFKLIYRK